MVIVPIAEGQEVDHAADQGVNLPLSLTVEAERGVEAEVTAALVDPSHGQEVMHDLTGHRKMIKIKWITVCA